MSLMPIYIIYPALYAFLSYNTIKANKALLSDKFYIVPTVLRGNPYFGLLLWLIKCIPHRNSGAIRKGFKQHGKLAHK
ncbi:MAG: hypothetical protein DBP02_08425 [gamma proteobacterium symbiont of Ctena orbiculata]|nr:MAG: hypothetical protein DBP02_08425 [gamma proteobacterium symbiont of Ctena orbiculata]PUB91756.1 MAG: hypothetical protein DBP01_00650 [gamma proteobacterium symbiont of Ctena orbiculata]